MADALPKGVWFEERRHRWRVRLYRDDRVHRSYHKSLDAALAALAELRSLLEAKGARERPRATVAGLMNALRR